MDISIVIPVRNEQENIAILAGEISEVFSKTNYSWECVWVDDGSTDASAAAMKEAAKLDPHHRYVLMAYHRGQSTGMVAGLRTACGEVIVTMDGDGQNDPRDAPRLAQMVFNGEADAVIGYRQKRQDSFVRLVSSRIANGFRNWLIGEKIRDVGCAVRAFRRAFVSNLITFEGMHRFMPTMLRLNGATVIETAVNHRPRTKGKTKYGINNRLWVGLLDSFGVRWLMFRRVHYQIAETSPASEESKK